MVKTTTLAIILAAMIISVVLAEEADAAGLVKRAISTAGTWRITDLPSVTVFNNQSNTYSGSNTQSFGTNAITSGSDPADAGNFRLSNTGTIAWEASPAGTDVDLQVDANEDFLFDTDANNINFNSNPLTNMVLGGTANANGNILDNVASINDNSGAEAGSGVLRVGNAVDAVCWEASPAANDVCINVDVNEDFLFDTDANNINFNSNPLTGVVLGADVNANQFTINGWDVETISTTNTLGTDNEIILVNPSTSAYTITLPDANGNTGKQYKFVMISTTGQPVTIDGDGSDTIGGRTSQIIEHYGEIIEIVSDGTNWQIINWDTLNNYNYIELVDDFESTGTGEVVHTIGSLGWGVLIDGGTADVQDGVDAIADRAGIVSIGSGTTSGNDWAIHLGASATLRFIDSDESNWSMTSVYRIPTITTVITRVGVAETITGASFEGADNAFFKFNPAVSANWQCVTFGASAETSTTGTAVVANTMYKQKIVKDGSTIRFYLDDVNVCNHSTQIPSANVSPVMQVETGAAALRNIQIDYFRFSAILER